MKKYFLIIAFFCINNLAGSDFPSFCQQYGINPTEQPYAEQLERCLSSIDQESLKLPVVAYASTEADKDAQVRETDDNAVIFDPVNRKAYLSTTAPEPQNLKLTIICTEDGKNAREYCNDEKPWQKVTLYFNSSGELLACMHTDVMSYKNWQIITIRNKSERGTCSRCRNTAHKLNAEQNRFASLFITPLCFSI